MTMDLRDGGQPFPTLVDYCARHGDWPLHPPGRFRGEEFKLYEQIVGPLEPCGPDCDAMCVCDTELDEEKD